MALCCTALRSETRYNILPSVPWRLPKEPGLSTSASTRLPRFAALCAHSEGPLWDAMPCLLLLTCLLLQRCALVWGQACPATLCNPESHAMRQRTPLAFGLEVEAKIGRSGLRNTSIAAAAELFGAISATADHHHHKTERRAWSVQLDNDAPIIVCSHPRWRPLEIVSPKLYEPDALLPALQHMMRVGLAWDVTTAIHIHVDHGPLDVHALFRVLSCFVAHEHVFDSLSHASRRGDRCYLSRSSLRACNTWDSSWDVRRCLERIAACGDDFFCLKQVMQPARTSSMFLMEKRKYTKVNIHNEKWTRSSSLRPATPSRALLIPRQGFQ